MKTQLQAGLQQLVETCGSVHTFTIKLHQITITYSPNGPVKGLFSSKGLVGRVHSLPLLRKSSPKWPPDVKNGDINAMQHEFSIVENGSCFVEWTRKFVLVEVFLLEFSRFSRGLALFCPTPTQRLRLAASPGLACQEERYLIWVFRAKALKLL